MTEIMLNTNELPWIPIVPGIDVRLLYAGAESGRMTMLMRCKAGSALPPHKHYGAGEYLMLKGRMMLPQGDASAGTYGYEPLGSLHALTTFPEDSELLFTNYGPVAFVGEDGQVAGVIDCLELERRASEVLDAS